jgi:hypothetical protein
MNNDITEVTSMDKLKATGQNLGRVFILRRGHLHSANFLWYQVKLPNLKQKTWQKQLIGSHPLDVTLPVTSNKLGFLNILQNTNIIIIYNQY